MSAVATAAPPEITPDLPAEPYPGLRPFEPGEWAIFFGREPMIDEVIRLLAGQHLVVVHGASGCGKSSLVRAGVLPWLALDHAASEVPWRTAIARPAGGPLRNIAAQLATALGPPPGATGDPGAAWHDRLALGSVALPDLQAALETGGASLCLLIDQFEELFRWARDDREEAQLVTELLRLIADDAVSRLFVILTMRSDYLGACAGYEGFAETVNRCQYLLPRMDDFALLRAIHEPASLYGGAVAPEVGDRLLFEARREQDPLPVLQHTLMRACRHGRDRHGPGEGWAVTADDVAAVEGMDGALAAHAEEVLACVITGDEQRLQAAEWVFRTITDLDAEGRLVRRPRPLGELVAVGGDRAAVIAVVEAFCAPGCSFLTIQPAGDLTDASEIDIAHEAFIRRWPRLASEERNTKAREPSGWVWREFEDGLKWRALAVQAQTYKHDRNATLSPATTEAYSAWWPGHSEAWAVRYAKSRSSAQEEHSQVTELWSDSRRELARDRRRRNKWRRAAFYGGFAFLIIGLMSYFWFGVKLLEERSLTRLADLYAVALANCDLRIGTLPPERRAAVYQELAVLLDAVSKPAGAETTQVLARQRSIEMEVDFIVRQVLDQTISVEFLEREEASGPWKKIVQKCFREEILPYLNQTTIVSISERPLELEFEFPIGVTGPTFVILREENNVGSVDTIHYAGPRNGHRCSIHRYASHLSVFSAGTVELTPDARWLVERALSCMDRREAVPVCASSIGSRYV